MGCPSCQAPATLAASLVTLCTRRSGPKTCAIPGQCSSERNEEMGSTHLAVRGLSLAGVACLRHREGLARQCHCNHCTRAATTMHCLVQSARERQSRAVFPCVCLHRPCVRHLRHCYRESCCAERTHTPKRKHNRNGLNMRSQAQPGQCKPAGPGKTIEFRWARLRPSVQIPLDTHTVLDAPTQTDAGQ